MNSDPSELAKTEARLIAEIRALRDKVDQISKALEAQKYGVTTRRLCITDPEGWPILLATSGAPGHGILFLRDSEGTPLVTLESDPAGGRLTIGARETGEPRDRPGVSDEPGQPRARLRIVDDSGRVELIGGAGRVVRLEA